MNPDHNHHNTPDVSDASHNEQSRSGMTRRDMLKHIAGGFGAAMLGNTLPTSAEEPKEAPKPLNANELKKILPDRVHEDTVEHVTKNGLSCFDDRSEEDEGIAGVAGGDAGVAVAVLGAAEKSLKKTFTDEEIEKYIDSLEGKIRMHTDEHALEGHEGHSGLYDQIIEKSFATDKKQAKIVWERGTGDINKNNELAIILAEAEIQGCGHLKNAMSDEETYGIRKDLSEKVVTGFIKRKWKNAKGHEAIIEELHGPHAARGLVNVKDKRVRNGKSVVTLLEASEAPDGQFFVNSPTLAEIRISQFIDALKALYPELKIDEVQLKKEATELFSKQSGETTHRLAKGKNIVDLEINENGEREVKDAGQVQ